MHITINGNQWFCAHYPADQGFACSINEGEPDTMEVAFQNG